MGKMYEKILITTLQNNTSALRIGNSTNSANLSMLNIYLDQLKYATRQFSNLTVNAARLPDELTKKSSDEK